MKIAITGGIGSGKSYVCKRLNDRGIDIYDCDTAAKRLIRSSQDIRQRLTALIGSNTYIDGRLNKAAVAEFLLASESNAKAIDNIVHPAVAQDFEQSGMTWMECAILYESGFNRLVDRVIAVTAPTPLRIKRVAQRDSISESKAQEWINRQMDQEEVARRADYVIINDGKADIDSQIEHIINNIINKSNNKKQ